MISIVQSRLLPYRTIQAASTTSPSPSHSPQPNKFPTPTKPQPFPSQPAKMFPQLQTHYHHHLILLRRHNPSRHPLPANIPPHQQRYSHLRFPPSLRRAFPNPRRSSNRRGDRGFISCLATQISIISLEYAFEEDYGRACEQAARGKRRFRHPNYQIPTPHRFRQTGQGEGRSYSRGCGRARRRGRRENILAEVRLPPPPFPYFPPLTPRTCCITKIHERIVL